MCEPLAFEGTFFGTTTPAADSLRIPDRQGLDWVGREDGVPVRLGDAARDPRTYSSAPPDDPESMLIVPMVHQDTVRGVIVVTALGRDRFDTGRRGDAGDLRRLRRSRRS